MTLFSTAIVPALISTITALVTGLASMAHGGKFNRNHSGQFMIARAGSQSIALALLLIALYIANS